MHWGTFNLAMHAWDQPAETLLELAPKTGARLLMPRLGEAIEPAHGEIIKAWWRSVDDIIGGKRRAAEAALTFPKAMPWPMD